MTLFIVEYWWVWLVGVLVFEVINKGPSRLLDFKKSAIAANVFGILLIISVIIMLFGGGWREIGIG